MTVIVSLLHKHESQHGPVVDEFVSWCDKSFLQLNISKTKIMAIDFRRNQSCSPPPTYINGNCIEMVDQYKYLGTMIDKKLKFDVLFARRGNNDCTSFGSLTPSMSIRLCCLYFINLL